MANLNRFTGIGTLGRDPEVRYMPSGSAVTSFSIAINEKWKDKQSGEQKESTEWVNVTAFNRLAEICRDYLKKGSQVYIEGKLKTDKYQKDGVDVYSTKVIIHTMQMIGGKQESNGNAPQQNSQNQRQQSSPPQNFDNFEDNQIPF